MHSKFIHLVIIMLLALSCSKDEIGKTLSGLDRVIQNTDKYHLEYENELKMLRAGFDEAETDSLKWNSAYGMYNKCYHNSLDSTYIWLGQMERFASTDRQRFRTSLCNMLLQVVRLNDRTGLDRWASIERDSIPDNDMYTAYLSAGISMYYQLYKDDASPGVRDSLQALRKEYLSVKRDDSPFYNMKIEAQYCRENGEIDKALAMFLAIFPEEGKANDRASTAYNIAVLYGMKNMDAERIEWLVKSAENDIMSSSRDYLSLYELALILYDRKMYALANRYIERNLADAFDGKFSSRYFNSGKAYLVITKAEQEKTRVMTLYLTVMVVCLSVFSVVIFGLLLYVLRQRSRLREAHEKVSRINAELKDANMRLADANKIKDSYVIRYMELSLKYLERLDEFRHEMRSVARANGSEEAMKMLRSPVPMYKEYDNYYKIFDETFLGIFPDFVEKINALLKDEARFPHPKGNVLPTELRILAAIRIGITESGKIASFLKCAPPTVYTYRTKMRNSAVCPKDEFEMLIRKI